MKTLFAFFLLIFALYSAAPASAAEDTIVSGPRYRTELWNGKILTATFRAGMCFAPNGYAKGVFILRHSNGDEDVYHVKGHWQNDEFTVEHGSGHKFSGQFVSDSKIKGKVKLNKGMTLNMSGNRTHNVRLIAHDCAPLK
ncbi:MAG: hypothetical protein K2H64_00310 [Desulfovibrio sp.]|nr:hypothetical protein [Desulfovibrio sp.]